MPLTSRWRSERRNGIFEVACVFRACIHDRVKPKGFEKALFRKPGEIRAVDGSRLASANRVKLSAMTVGMGH